MNWPFTIDCRNIFVLFSAERTFVLLGLKGTMFKCHGWKTTHSYDLFKVVRDP